MRLTFKGGANAQTGLLIAAGLVLCLSGPVRAQEVQPDDSSSPAQATEQAEPAGKPVALNKYSKRKRGSRQVARAQKPRVIAKGYRSKAIEADAAPTAIPVASTDQDAIPASVANANAQWPAPDTTIQPVTPGTAQPAPGATAANQLNDKDRSLTESANGDDPASQIANKVTSQVAENPSQAAGANVPSTASPAMSAMASADKPEVAANDDSAWGQSSLVGKIFIAFGGLLTVASAARMFMA